MSDVRVRKLQEFIKQRGKTNVDAWIERSSHRFLPQLLMFM